MPRVSDDLSASDRFDALAAFVVERVPAAAPEWRQLETVGELGDDLPAKGVVRARCSTEPRPLTAEAIRAHFGWDQLCALADALEQGDAERTRDFLASLNHSIRAEIDRRRRLGAEEVLRRRRVDEIERIVESALGWFDESAIAVSCLDEDYRLDRDEAVWAAAKDALRSQGYDPESPEVETVAWEFVYDARAAEVSAESWIGALHREAQRREFEQRERLARRRGHAPARFRRRGGHRRASRGRAVRPRGSRRVSSRSAGGGSSGDDPPGEHAAGERPRRQYSTSTIGGAA